MADTKNEEKEKGMARGAGAGAQQSGQRQGRNLPDNESRDRGGDQSSGSKRQPEQGRDPGGYDEKQPAGLKRDQQGRRDD